MTAFNPQRLSVARRRRGLTKTALAAELELSVRMVTSYERGEKAPADVTLDRIARSLDFPRAFFLGDDLSEPSIDGTSFRALSNLTARERDQALGAATLALSLAEWMDLRFDLPLPDVATYPGVDPETAAMSIRAEWGAGQRPIRNMMHLLEAHGVRFFSLVDECSAVDAFSFWSGERPFIVANTRKSAERRRMDAAHELGHLVLHPRGTAHGRQQEWEAAQFASNFLMPEGSVRADAPYGATLRQIVSAKHQWRVSTAALTYRMHQLGMITDWQYRSHSMEIGRRGYRTEEPPGTEAETETSTLLSRVFESLRARAITREQIAYELQIELEELNKLVFGLTLAPIGGSRDESSRPVRLGQARPTFRIVD